jgi:enolase
LPQYPVVSIEDGFSEDDWEGWKIFTEAMGKKVQIVGDDIFVTNPSILRKGIDKGVANSVLIKLNQIGTVTETIEAIEMAKAGRLDRRGVPPLGETEDSTIADLVVGLSTGRSRPARPRGPTGSRNTTSSSGSRKSSGKPPASTAGECSTNI